MKITELVEKFRQADQSSHFSIHFNRLAEELGKYEDSEVLPEQTLDLYLWIREQLQLVGAGWSSGTPTHDDHIWKDLTRALGLVRGVLVKEFGAELPEPRVVSMVTEMIEAGDLVVTNGADDGATYVKSASEDPFRMRIRIVRVPRGPAPESFRELWVGMELPARRGVPCSDVSRFAPSQKTYVVPINRALALLCERSEEAAAWFVNNFRNSRTLIFVAEEVEVLS